MHIFCVLKRCVPFCHTPPCFVIVHPWLLNRDTAACAYKNMVEMNREPVCILGQHVLNSLPSGANYSKVLCKWSITLNLVFRMSISYLA